MSQKSPRPVVAFRADASSLIGIGHVSRCLFLAEALRDLGYFSVFLCQRLPRNAGEKIWDRGFQLRWLNAANLDVEQSLKASSQIRDAMQTVEKLSQTACRCLVLDHYRLGMTWEKYVSGRLMIPVVVLEDMPLRRHSCNMLVNPSLARTVLDYRSKTPPSCRFLLGPRYALVPKKFVSSRPRNRLRSPKQILISMGGNDHANATVKILRRLREFRGISRFHVKVVLGSKAPWRAEVRRALSRLTPKSSLWINVRNMAGLMRQSQIGILAPGTIAWEALAAGLPSLLIATSRHQIFNARQLDRGGFARYLGRVKNLPASLLAKELRGLVDSESAWSRLSQKARSLVDGKGPCRVARGVVSLIKRPRVIK